MKQLQLGLVLNDFRAAFPAQETDPVDLLLLRSTWINPPRTKAAESIYEKLRKTHKHAEMIPYIWHLVSHRPNDRAFSRATRLIAGEPTNFGHLQPTKEVHQAWEVSLQIATTFQAKRIILRTPPSFTPSQENQNRLHMLSKQCSEMNLQLWWEVEGLWQQEMLFSLAQQLNIWLIHPAFDRTGRIIEEHLSSPCLLIDSFSAIHRLRDVSAENLCIAVDRSEKVQCVLFAGQHGYANLHTFARYWGS